jgi:hypothetical protein
VDEEVAVGEGEAIVGSVCFVANGVESPALTELTVNWNIGQSIKVAISKIIEEEVNTTPRENLVREG